jgi:hypothetical protein
MNPTKLPIIAAISGDPGGAAAIAPVLEALLQSVDVRAFAYRQAKGLWEKRGIPFEEVAEHTTFHEAHTLLAGLSPSLLLTSTSVNGIDLERLFIAAARMSNVPSLSVLDFWTNYRARFSDSADQMQFLPDRIAVMDDRAREEMIAVGFDETRLEVTGQPALDDLARYRKQLAPAQRNHLRRALTVNENEILVCFASQPLTELYGTDPASASYLGYDQHLVLKLLADTLEKVAPILPQPLVLAIRPHPRERRESLLKVSSERFRIIIPSEIGSRDLIMASDLMTGMHSILLVEACYLGCPTLSLQPGLRQPDPLPTTRSGLTRAVYHAGDMEPALTEILLGRNSSLQADEAPVEQSGAAARVVKLALTMAGLT